jgi:predicted O-linked N-acetylglucosamine transferase (SPINDLY family)
MGTPVVGMRGDRGISRGTFSILRTLGEDALIAANVDALVEINLRLARNHPWRHGLHESLRARLQASPLMDAGTFVTALENHYQTMWRSWCARDRAVRSKPP